MKNEQKFEQESEIINPNLVCDIHTGREFDVNNQENVPSSVGTSQEIIVQMIYDNKKKVQKIMIKPKFFKCRDYIMESTKYSVDRVLKGYSKGIKFQKGETYTQYAKRMRAKEMIMN